MEKVVTYKTRFYKYSPKHKFLVSRGWEAKTEEKTKEFNASKGCLLYIIFPPLVLFSRSRRLKVTYAKVENTKEN